MCIGGPSVLRDNDTVALDYNNTYAPVHINVLGLSVIFKKWTNTDILSCIVTAVVSVLLFETSRVFLTQSWPKLVDIEDPGYFLANTL